MRNISLYRQEVRVFLHFVTMKRLFYAIMLLLVLSTLRLNAQSFVDRTHFEVMAGIGIENKGITPIDFSFKAHVEFVSVSYLFVTVEDNVSLYNHEDMKTYYNGVSIGGGLGVKLLNSLECIHALDIRAKALSSVGCPTWERTSYDISLAWYIRSGRFSPIVELGYRFIDSHTKGISNCGNAFLSIGFRY